MKKNCLNQGTALIAVVSTIAIALIVISSGIIVSSINVKIGLSKYQSQRAYQAAESLINDAVLKFIRLRDVPNPYSDWTDNCLQIKGIQCKMELDLSANGGLIDVWAKKKDILRHLQTRVEVLEDDSVSVSARREIY